MALSVDVKSNFYPVTLSRRDEAGLIFITCDDIPELYLVIEKEGEIRSVIDSALKVAFREENDAAQIYTNGRVSGPTIDTVVRVI